MSCMSHRVRKAAEKDIPTMLQLWDRVYQYDVSMESHFRWVLFEDAHKPSATTVLITNESDAILGFVSFVVVNNVGHLKALAVDGDQEDVATELLGIAEKSMQSEGATSVYVVKYTGNHYFFPGIDKRYTALLNFFLRNGYKETEETKDMYIELKNFSLDAQSFHKIETAAQKGIQIQKYTNDMFDVLQTFRSQTDNPTWFDHWDADKKPASGAFAALDGNQVVGFCEYKVSNEEGDFGPLEVLMDYRDKKIGSALLLKAMQAMQKLGAKQSTAKWVWPARLYESNGWLVDRTYAILEKQLKDINS